MISLPTNNQVLLRGNFLASQVTILTKLPPGQWVSVDAIPGTFRTVIDKAQAPWGAGINYRLDYLCLNGIMQVLTDGVDIANDF